MAMNGLSPARAMAMQGVRHQLLAAAGSAIDQYGGMRLRESTDGAKKLPASKPALPRISGVMLDASAITS